MFVCVECICLCVLSVYVCASVCLCVYQFKCVRCGSCYVGENPLTPEYVDR